LLYEQPNRSLTQLEAYLQLQFENYRLSRSSLARHLRAHPAFNGIEKLRQGHTSKLRALYEAQHPHEGWQLDGKGPFAVHLQKAGRVLVHVLSVLDDHSRYVLAAQLASCESEAAAIGVFEQAVGKWGLADRFQFDAGSAFEAKGFRQGLAQLGVHRESEQAF
jgi:transposase InsO family protein